jgi:hypothetical protein
MHRIHTASRITRETVASLDREERPVLVACLWSGARHAAQIADLHVVAEYFRESLSVHYALEDVFPCFRDTYSVVGTPTYLLLERGRGVKIILGITPFRRLLEEVRDFIFDPGRGRDGDEAAGRMDAPVRGEKDQEQGEHPYGHTETPGSTGVVQSRRGARARDAHSGPELP